jgi:hypothetical protein
MIGGDWAGACLADREGDAAAARPAPSRLQPAHAAACDGLLLRPQKRQVQGWLLPQAEQFVRSALLTSVQVVHCQSHAPTGGVGKRGVWTGRGSSALKTVLQEPHRTLMMRSPPEQAVSSTDEHVGHRTRTRGLDRTCSIFFRTDLFNCVLVHSPCISRSASSGSQPFPFCWASGLWARIPETRKGKEAAPPKALPERVR